MTDLERIKQEKRHSETELYKIHLYKNGDWWRATEWSAYLCQFCQNSDDGKKLRPIHRQLKGSDDGIVLVGLKLSSFEKYFPFVKIDDNSVIKDGHIEIDLGQKIDDNINIANYEKLLNDWKLSIPYCKSKSNYNSKLVDNGLDNLGDICNGKIYFVLKKILSYPLAQRTLLDNVNFINDMQHEIAAII